MCNKGYHFTFHDKGCEINKLGSRRFVVEGSRTRSNFYDLKKGNLFIALNVIAEKYPILEHMRTKAVVNDKIYLESDLEAMELEGWDINLDDFEVELWYALEDMDIARAECKEYKIKFNKENKIIVKLKAQIEGSK